MTLLAPTATLVTIAHDWSSPVERATSYPSRVLTHDDGTEQRLSLSHVPTSVLTYRLLAPTWQDAAQLAPLVDLATNAIVRMPRWEDQTRLTVTASAGDILINADYAARPTFVPEQQVLFWRSPSSYEVGVLDTVSDTQIRLYDYLASSWAPGTIVVPITAGRLTLPLALSQWAPTSGALTCMLSTSLTDVAGVGTGGTAAALAAASLTVTDVTCPHLGRGVITATVLDAAGEAVPTDAIVWSTSDPAVSAVYPTADSRVAIVQNLRATFFTAATATITATLGALSDTGTATLIW